MTELSSQCDATIALHHGDCLEIMPTLPAQSVDMILCDPPYGTTACKWDTVIPFEPLWKEYARIAKENAAIVLFGNEPFSSALRMSNIKAFKYDWVWDKKVGVNFLHAKRQPLKVHEIVSVFSLSAQPQYFPIKTPRRTPIRKGANVAGESSGYTLDASKFSGKLYTDAYPRTVLNFCKDSHAGNNFHPTQKPVALIEYLIKTYTHDGMTVLDNCMGSGSTGVACVNTDRRFIGIEKEEIYFKTALERIGEAQRRSRIVEASL